MRIHTSRFGRIEVAEESVISFPAGVLGFAECRRWVLVDDARNDAVAWLQSLDRPLLAFALVNPRRFVPDYRARVSRQELSRLGFGDLARLEVLVIVGGRRDSMTLNLKAPIVLDPERRLGCQMVAEGDLPIRHAVAAGGSQQKRIA